MLLQKQRSSNHKSFLFTLAKCTVSFYPLSLLYNFFKVLEAKVLGRLLDFFLGVILHSRLASLNKSVNIGTINVILFDNIWYL